MIDAKTLKEVHQVIKKIVAETWATSSTNSIEVQTELDNAAKAHGLQPAGVDLLSKLFDGCDTYRDLETISLALDTICEG